ncbi:MAG: glycosyltransferase family 4 protein [Planctomycetota bacterium]
MGDAKPEASPERLEVVLVSPLSDQRGGAELSLMHLVTGGNGYGVNWSLAVPGEGDLSAAARSAGASVHLTGGVRLRRPLGYASAVRGLSRFVRSHRASLVLSWLPHAHYWSLPAAALAGASAAWFQKDQVKPEKLNNRLTARLPRRGILANSVFTAELQGQLSPSAAIDVVPSAVELDRFAPDHLGTPEACRGRLGLPAEGPLVGMVGRLQEWKGFGTALRALGQVRAEVPDAKLVLIGGPHTSEPEYPEELRRLAASEGLSGAVVFVGEVEHDLVPQYMQACDVLVHASRAEPFGVVVIEAMALGKPLVASAEGGPATTVREGVDGLLAGYGDSAALAAAVTRLLRGGAEVERMSVSARQRARGFSVDVFRRRMADAVGRVLGPRRSPGIYVDGQAWSVDETGVGMTDKVSADADEIGRCELNAR